MFIITSSTKKISALTKRIRAVQGSTAASKTISILLLLIDKAQRDTAPTITSVVSESLPHLKKGAMRDFLAIMKEQHYFNDKNWNKTSYTYTFETGSIIEFFSANEPAKVRGPRRQRLFINEANNISYETFTQLEIRTSELIYLDWNPTNEFWFYDKVKDRDDADFLVVTYRDNEGLGEEMIKVIERRKIYGNWWRVYGEGQLGIPEASVYKDWKIIETIPMEAELMNYGLDFGYTNDPTAVVAVYKYNDEFILDEVIYETGLLNMSIADRMNKEPEKLIVADSAEPKSIDELRSYGLSVMPAVKGSGSVNYRIQLVQSKKISVTSGSTNIIKEYRNYMYVTDKNGKILNDPQDWDNHAMDAIGYAFTGLSYVAQNKDSVSPILDELRLEMSLNKRTGYFK